MITLYLLFLLLHLKKQLWSLNILPNAKERFRVQQNSMFQMCTKWIVLLISMHCFLYLQAQPDRWQQRIKYVMDVNLDVNTNRIAGKQIITYFNNSPDTLKRIFIHLFWNAFKPGSMMDVSSRSTENLVIGAGC